MVSPATATTKRPAGALTIADRIAAEPDPARRATLETLQRRITTTEVHLDGLRREFDRLLGVVRVAWCPVCCKFLGAESPTCGSCHASTEIKSVRNSPEGMTLENPDGSAVEFDADGREIGGSTADVPPPDECPDPDEDQVVAQMELLRNRLAHIRHRNVRRRVSPAEQSALMADLDMPE